MHNYIYINIIAACVQPCLNGGRCGPEGTCLCLNGWRGSQCEEGKKHHVTSITLFWRYPAAVCSNECLNGGMCIAPNYCSCSPQWKGIICEQRKQLPLVFIRMHSPCMHNFYACTAVCNPGCENGGRCEEPGVCTCPIGWTGRSCEQGKGYKIGYMHALVVHALSIQLITGVFMIIRRMCATLWKWR